jgi:hypothetical protein
MYQTMKSLHPVKAVLEIEDVVVSSLVRENP